MTTETTITITANARQALAAAGAERRKARATFEAATAAHDSAREVLRDAQAAADRLTAEERNWIERHGRKLFDWIEAGSRGQRPVATADAKATLALASARANLAAAEVAVPRFEAAERAAAHALERAEDRVRELKLEAHRAYVDHLIACRAELEAEVTKIREIAGATIAAAEMALTNTVEWSPQARAKLRQFPAGTRAFLGVLTPGQLDQLNSPASCLDIASLHAPHRPSVAVNEPIAAPRDRLAECVAHWHQRDAELDAIAETGEVSQAQAAA